MKDSYRWWLFILRVCISLFESLPYKALASIKFHLFPFRSNAKGGNILILLMQFSGDVMHAVVVKVRVEVQKAFFVGGGGGDGGGLVNLFVI